jgi:hypothetical protein
MPLPTTARTAITRACAQVSPRRAAGEDLARSVLDAPDLHTPHQVECARIVLGISGEGV